MASVNLRVLNYNVRGFRDDMAALATIINEVAPDILTFQEIPRWWFSRSRSNALLNATGLVRAVGGGGWAYGNMVAARPDVVIKQTAVVKLPKMFREQPRAASWARCELAGVEFVMTGVHLGHHYYDRARHLYVLLNELPDDVPLIIAGDLNENAGGPIWKRLGRHLRDCGADDPTPTYSTTKPRRRIDAIFADPAFTLVGYHVFKHELAAQATDHFPVYVDLNVDDRG